MSDTQPASRFDELARSWDNHPARVQTAWNLAQIIRREVPLTPATRLLDYGCGTGLVTLALHEQVGEIVAVDSSAGMLAVLGEKLAAAGITNVQTRQADLQVEDLPVTGCEVIISTMTLHHIADLPLVVRRLAGALRAGGWLAVADLDEGAEAFHGPAAGVEHHGLSADTLTRLFTAAGLQQVQTREVHRLQRPDAAGNMREYGVLLATGQQPG